MLILALVVVILVPARSAHGGVLYVSPAGSDASTCATPATPCRNPDSAVNRAANGDTIQLAGGTYVFANVANACAGVPVRSVICVVNKSVTILGGYSASTWAFDPGANPTVIDGENTYRGVFLFTSGTPNVRLTMANVTIQNGLAPGAPGEFGGGIEVQGAAVTLEGVTLQNNRVVGGNTGSGAGGDAAGSALSIRSSVGGAISTLSNVVFQNNSSQAGQGANRGGYAFGALFVFASTVQVANSRFIANTAQGGISAGSGDLGGSRADALGGAIGVGGGGNLTLTEVTAIGNQALGGRGAQFGGGAFGGAVFVEDSTATIADSTFQSNVVRGGASASGGFVAGGGVLLFNSNGRIDRTQIIANRATGGDSSPGQPAGNGGGGGLDLWRNTASAPVQTIQVTNTVIADNRVELGQGTNSGGGGGGLGVQGLSADLSHVTFAGNQLGPGLVAGQAMVVVEAPGAATTTVNLSHSVVANHVAATSGATALVVTPTNTLNLNGGAFSGNTNNTNANNVPMPPGTITGLPSVVNVGALGFVSPGAPNYDYHINAGSPLRNTANGSTTQVDVDDQPRGDLRPDIGADEYKTVVFGDFNGDGKADILFRQSSGTVAVWLMNGTTVAASAVLGTQPLEWRIAGVGDFNGDGKADILWRHSSGTVAIWLTNGTSVIGSPVLAAVPLDWQIAGVGDFNGDGKADILWRHSSGIVAIWLTNGTSIVGSGFLGAVPLDWQIAGVGDFNGDGKADILWRHTSGMVGIWLLNGTNVAGTGALGGPGTDWVIVGVGDFNGDGRADILWRHTSGTVGVWLLNGTSVAGTGGVGSVPSDWGIVGAGDFNGDRHADILWQHVSGVVAAWLLNGTSILGTGVVGNAGGGWQIE